VLTHGVAKGESSTKHREGRRGPYSVLDKNWEEGQVKGRTEDFGGKKGKQPKKKKKKNKAWPGRARGRGKKKAKYHG